MNTGGVKEQISNQSCELIQFRGSSIGSVCLRWVESEVNKHLTPRISLVNVTGKVK